jgi:hypothetical protein
MYGRIVKWGDGSCGASEGYILGELTKGEDIASLVPIGITFVISPEDLNIYDKDEASAGKTFPELTNGQRKTRIKRCVTRAFRIAKKQYIADLREKEKQALESVAALNAQSTELLTEINTDTSDAG